MKKRVVPFETVEAFIDAMRIMFCCKVDRSPAESEGREMNSDKAVLILFAVIALIAFLVGRKEW